jgi:hypothetical protein
MRDHLTAIDPLPELPRGFRLMSQDNGWSSVPASRRHEAEMAKKRDKLFGEDWRPTDNPLIEVNGKGQMRTKDYKPPEPPETDVILMVNADCYELFWPDGVPQEDWVPTFVDDLDSVVKNVPGLTEHRFKLTELRALYTAT